LIRNDQIQDSVQEIPTKRAKNIPEDDLSTKTMKTIAEIKGIEWDPEKKVCSLFHYIYFY
jgi:hypothetical protein